MSRIMQALFICLIFTGFEVESTTFVPVSLERQLKESSGVIIGEYLGETYKRMPSGQIITEATIKLDQTAGIDPNHLVNKNNIKVIYPGGLWQDMVYQVHGAPKFSKGRKVALLLKKDAHGFWVNNLALGKYNIVKRDGELSLVSEVFPNHPNFKKITMNDFTRMVSNVYGTELGGLTKNIEVITVHHEKEHIQQYHHGDHHHGHNLKTKRKREIASIRNDESSQKDEPKSPLFGLALMFIFIGGIFGLIRKKSE